MKKGDMAAEGIMNLILAAILILFIAFIVIAYFGGFATNEDKAINSITYLSEAMENKVCGGWPSTLPQEITIRLAGDYRIRADQTLKKLFLEKKCGTNHNTCNKEIIYINKKAVEVWWEKTPVKTKDYPSCTKPNQVYCPSNKDCSGITSKNAPPLIIGTAYGTYCVNYNSDWSAVAVWRKGWGSC